MPFVQDPAAVSPFSQQAQQLPLAQTVNIVQQTGASFCEGKADGLHADPIDCLSYIHCVRGTDYRTTCPDGTAFDDKYGVCDYTANVKRCKQNGFR